MAKEDFIVQKEIVGQWVDACEFFTYEAAYTCLQDLSRLTKKKLRIIRRIETVIIHDED